MELVAAVGDYVSGLDAQPSRAMPCCVEKRFVEAAMPLQAEIRSMTPEDQERMGNWAGNVLGGSAAGAATGAVIGSVVPGIGTLAGAAVGFGIGWLSGAFKGFPSNAEDHARKAASSFDIVHPASSPTSQTPIPPANLTGYSSSPPAAAGADVLLDEKLASPDLDVVRHQPKSAIDHYDFSFDETRYTVEIELRSQNYGAILTVDFNSAFDRGMDALEAAVRHAFNRLDVRVGDLLDDLDRDEVKSLILFDSTGSRLECLDLDNRGKDWLRQFVTSTKITSCVEVVEIKKYLPPPRLSSSASHSVLTTDPLIPCRLTFVTSLDENSKIYDRIVALRNRSASICTAASLCGISRLDVFAGGIFVKDNSTPLPIAVVAERLICSDIIDYLKATIEVLTEIKVSVSQF